jgi:hypothetical protein
VAALPDDDALKVRQQAYWSYFAGGYHTYGNTITWNFGTFKPEATQDWKAALQSPGAANLTVLARFFRSLEWWQLVPDESLFASGAGSGATRNAAMRSLDGDRLLVYFSSPSTASIQLERITRARTARARWLDPRTGAPTAIDAIPTTGARSFTVPEGWPDALLVIETAGSGG